MLPPAAQTYPYIVSVRTHRHTNAIPDELRYMALDKRGAELLFQVLTEREEKNSVAIPSLSGCSETPRSPRVHRGGW